MQVIRPRLVEYEDGWTSPWEKSEEVVGLLTCRRIPETDEIDDDADMASEETREEE